MDGKIVITIDKETGIRDIDIQNVAPEIMSQVFGQVLKKMTDDEYINTREDFLIKNLLVLLGTAEVDLTQYLGRRWLDLKKFKPQGVGPYICLNTATGHIFRDMYYDKEAGVFGDRNGVGYSDLTHWIHEPRLD